MRVTSNSGNLLYDDEDVDCFIRVVSGQGGQNFAFIQCVDMGRDDQAVGVRRYWGAWDVEDPATSMQGILRNGGKWPDLPGAHSALID